MSSSSTAEIPQDPISNEVWAYLNSWIFVVFGFIINILSFISNGINISIFAYQGLNDGMNFSLFSLGLSDFLGALSLLGYSLSIISGLVITTSDKIIELYILADLFGVLRCMFTDLTLGLTLFISVERCLCVTFPFVFSRSFTVRKTRIIVAAIMAFILANYIPIFAPMRYSWEKDVFTNKTKLTAYFLSVETAMQIRDFNTYIMAVAACLVCQVGVLLCAIFIARGLRKSSEIRRVSTKGGKDKSSSEKQSVMSLKEKRVVKMVFVVSICYLFTSIPQTLMVFSYLAVPEVYSFLNVYNTTMGIVFLCGAINGFVNIFIYWNYNPYYKVSVYRLLFCNSKDDSGKETK